MPFCPACGKEVQGNARFCPFCGNSVGSEIAEGTATTKATVVEPKRAGRLALKGFGLAFLIAVIANLALSKPTDAQTLAAWRTVAFGIGAAYIVTNLRKWKRQKEDVRAGGIAWTVAAFLIVGCVGSLFDIANIGPSSTRTGTGSGTIDSKAELLRSVKLDYTWSKESFGSIMIADFTVHNPTRYRFKDFEIKCTHFAPSGTEIDSNTRTIYEIVEPNATKIIKQQNMGFINTQSARSACEITDLAVVP